MPILQTCEGRVFKPPSELGYLTPYALHHDKPIFNDLLDEQYLAPEYGERYKGLKKLGVEMISFSELLDRLEEDLISPHSKMRSLAPDDEWHESCAALLLQVFEDDWRHRKRIKQMTIIPFLTIFRESRWADSLGL